MDSLRDGAKEAVPSSRTQDRRCLGDRHGGARRIFSADFLATSPPEGQVGV